MKRKIPCLLLAAVLLVSISGCNMENELAGTWTGEVDALQTVLPLLPGGLSKLSLGSFPVTLTLTLTREGTFAMSVDRQTVQTALEAMWQQAEKLLTSEDTVSEGIVGSLENLLGMTKEKLKEALQSYMEDAQLEEKIVQAYQYSGTYDDDGKQLLLTDQEGSTFLTSSYLLLGSKLTLTKPFPGITLLTLERK